MSLFCFVCFLINLFSFSSSFGCIHCYWTLLSAFPDTYTWALSTKPLHPIEYRTDISLGIRQEGKVGWMEALTQLKSISSNVSSLKERILFFTMLLFSLVCSQWIIISSLRWKTMMEKERMKARWKLLCLNMDWISK